MGRHRSIKLKTGSEIINLTQKCPRKVFKILKQNPIKNNQSENSYTYQTDEEIAEEHRVKPHSKVNFSKLSDSEKDSRLKNLSSLITRLRKKIRNLDSKYSNLTEIKLKKILNDKIGNNCNLNLDELVQSLKILYGFNHHEFRDQIYLIQNLIKLISSGKLRPDSINYKKICTQVRMMLNIKDIEYISSDANSIDIDFGENSIKIGPSEYEHYKDFINNERVMRLVFGLHSRKEYPDLIKFNSNNMFSQGYYLQLLNLLNANNNI